MAESKQLSFENTEVAFQHLTTPELYRAVRLFRLLNSNTLVKVGSSLTELAVKLHFPITPFVKPIIFDYFCGGETLEETKKLVNKLASYEMGVMLNYGVEAIESEEGFDQTLKVNIDAVKYAAENPTVKTICVKISGFGEFALFEREQREGLKTEEDKETFERILNRLDLLCQAGAAHGVSLYMDAEETWIQDVLDEIVTDLMKKYNTSKAMVLNTFQMYRHDRLAYLDKMIKRAQAEGFILGAKLVRGAYVEKEREYARKHGLEDPIHVSKDDCDRDFDLAIDRCLENVNHVSVSIASHNEASNLHAVKKMEELGIDKRNAHVWFSQLYGMGDHISFNLADYGVNATKYVPYGPVRKVIPYLIRRADENSSVGGQMSRELRLLEQELRRRG